MFQHELDSRFDFHPPSDVRKEKHEGVRDLIKQVATHLNYHLPEGREKQLVMTKLEEAMFWANASIARASSYDMALVDGK